MKNGIQNGKVMEFTAPAGGVTSGTPVMIGALLVIPVVDAAVGETFAGAIEGVVKMEKTTGVAPTQGGKAYWNNTTKKVTSTSASGVFPCGVFAKAYVSADTEAEVRLDGIAVTAVP